MLLPLVTTDIVGLVPNVASNLWPAYLQNFGSVTVTGSTSMANILLFLSFGSICAAAIENSKNQPQSSFMKLISVLIIVSDHILNSFGVRPFLLSHSTNAYGTTASLGNCTMLFCRELGKRSCRKGSTDEYLVIYYD